MRQDGPEVLQRRLSCLRSGRGGPRGGPSGRYGDLRADRAGARSRGQPRRWFPRRPRFERRARRSPHVGRLVLGAVAFRLLRSRPRARRRWLGWGCDRWQSAAHPNGARPRQRGVAQLFSQTRTPATVPGSMASARFAMSSAASTSAIWVSILRNSSTSSRSSISRASTDPSSFFRTNVATRRILLWLLLLGI